MSDLLFPPQSAPRQRWQWFGPTIALCALLAATMVLTLSSTYEYSLGWTGLVVGFVIALYVGRQHPSIAVVLTVGFLIRALLALTHVHVAPVPGADADAIRFERIAGQWSELGLVGAFEQFQTGAYLISWIASILYAATDQSPLMVQALNVILGTLTILYVFRTSQLLWGARVAQRAAWLACLFPTLILYSAIIMREAPIAFLVSVAAFNIVIWTKCHHNTAFIKATAAFGVAALFHTGMFFALPAMFLIVLIRMFYSIHANRPEGFLKFFRASLVVAACVAAIATTGYGLEKLGGSLTDFEVDAVRDYQQIAARGGAAYLEGIAVSGPADFVWQTPVRLVFFLFSPFVWMIRTTGHLVGLLDATLFLAMLALLYYCRDAIRRSLAARRLLVALTAIAIVFSLGVSNFGTAVRHRAKIAPIVICLIARFPSARPVLDRRPVEPGPDATGQACQD